MKTPEELYDERETRLWEAIQLRVPDRVPVILGCSYFPTKYTGIPASAAYYDPKSWKEAIRKVVLDLEPDAYRSSAGMNSGTVFEILGTSQIRWPGHDLPDRVTHQFVEGEYMREGEYDLFLYDPTGFLLRCYLPRIFKALEPLSQLPSLLHFSATQFTAVLPFFSSPGFEEIAAILGRAGHAEKQWRELAGNLEVEMAGLGFPPHGHRGGVGGAPFDAISDNLRGMRGAMIDMYRQPDKLLEACERILTWRRAGAKPARPTKLGNPRRVFVPLHRGAEGFMSDSQFERFYWPGLKKAVEANNDLGFVPMLFCEGAFTSRLERLLELPKGKAVCHFEHTDMARAKEVLGGHLCIMGNVPSSLLQVGSVQEVEDYCKKLIGICGKDGGFILSNGSSIDDAKPENVKAMIDSVKTYGVY